jgi:hypothetical protein
MIENAPAVLDRLLWGSGGARSEELTRSRELAGVALAEGELAGLYDEFLELFDAAVARVSREWGPPDVSGQYGDDGCPEWFGEAVVTASWRRDTADAYVAFTHPDHDSPLAIVVGVRSDEAQNRPR